MTGTFRIAGIAALMAGQIWGALVVDNPGAAVSQQNRQCIIGDPSCGNNDVLGFTTIGVNLSSFDLLSPVYLVSEIRNIVTDTFSVGIDVNAAQSTHVLDLFEIYINGGLADSYTGPLNLVLNFQGNGFSDSVIRGFDLAGLQGTDEVQFRAVMSGLDSGRESLFLIEGGSSDPAGVPEPGAWFLVSGGLVAVILRRRASSL